MRRILSLLTIVIFFCTPAQLAGKSSLPTQTAQLTEPLLVDPGFEMFALAPGPIFGWYCDDVLNSDAAWAAQITMTPDATDRVEGSYSLHINQSEPRPVGQGFASLSQTVSLPDGVSTRRFTLSTAIRGRLNQLLTIIIYVWDTDGTALEVARRELTISDAWYVAKLKFKLPHGHHQFGIWFYLPNERGAELWLDDVRLRPKEN